MAWGWERGSVPPHLVYKKGEMNKSSGKCFFSPYLSSPVVLLKDGKF